MTTKTKERAISTKIQTYLRLNGAYVVKYHGNQFSIAGVPDLLVCYKGDFYGLEIKTDMGKVSRLQEIHADQIARACGKWYVLRSLEDAYKVFEPLGANVKGLRR